MAYRLLAILLAALLLAACGGDKCADAADCGAGGGGGGSPVGCEPGAAIFCKCPNGESGSQVCSDDGTEFEACRLPSGDPCP